MPVSEWRSAVRFDDHGPGVTVLHESAELKVVLVGLRAGQQLPVHPGPAASFTFLNGEAVMVVGDGEVPVAAGGIVICRPVPTVRYVRSPTRCSSETSATRARSKGPTEQRQSPELLRRVTRARHMPGPSSS